ncbi:MAG: AMP-binding protein [Sphingomonas sp.]
MAETTDDTGFGQAATLSDLAAQALTRDPLTRAIEYEGRWFSWGAVSDLAREVAALADAAGLPAGAPLALVARNRPEMVAALIGLIAAGRSVQMIYAFQAPVVIARDIETLRPGGVIAMAADLDGPVRAALEAHGLAGIILDDMGARAAPGLGQARDPSACAVGAPQVEVLTSGTTGPPKRFPIPFEMISRHHMGNSGMAGAAARPDPDAPPFLLFFPLGNISGIYSTIPTMLRGQPATLLDRFTLEGWLGFIRRYRPAAAGLPPTAFRLLLDADVAAEDLASLKVMATGAAPLDPQVQRAFEERYGIPVLLSYGATEFGGPVAAMTVDLATQFGGAKLGTVGRAMPGARLRVVDPETGAEVPRGGEGLLEVVSPRIGPDWIRTSDIAVIDADDFLFIRGRADGAIIRGGFKLVPETIERALLLHPSVGAAAVVGVKDERLGEVPGAVVQPRPGAEPLAAAEAEAHLRAHLPSTHIPVHWRFVGELPKNPSMKIDRPAVKRLFDTAS